MKLNEKLYELRRAKHLSQEQLAEKLNVSRQAISKWENDENKPDLDNLKKLAEIFDVKIETLINDDSIESDLTPSTNKSKKNTIIIVIICSLVSLLLGYCIGNKNTSQITSDFFNSSQVIHDFKMEGQPNNNYLQTLETIPLFYDDSIQAEYTITQNMNDEKLTYPATYDGNAYVAEKIDFDPNVRYSIYITFTNKKLKKSVLLAENLSIDNNGASWNPRWNE